MRLFELEKRPTKAGKAKLDYGVVGEPSRVRRTIVIPNTPDLELFPLQDNWNQFLVITGRNRAVWFGGTDENPFLVAMDDDVLDNFFQRGSEGFYADLVPGVMTRLRDMFQTPWVRQGDVFAYPLPYSWDDLDKAFDICRGSKLGYKEVDARPAAVSVLGTRHRLCAGRFLAESVEILGLGVRVPVVEGRVEAPDHTPMTLVGPHVLSQTRHLYSPKEAD